MTHIDQGNYKGKHPDNLRSNQRIVAAIQQNQQDNRVTCANCERIADELQVSLEEVGREADLLEIKVTQCQLGLFGWGRIRGRSRIMEPAKNVSSQLETAIRDNLDDGKLTCVASWAIAEQLGVQRIEVCGAADALGIRTSRCQLGAF